MTPIQLLITLAFCVALFIVLINKLFWVAIAIAVCWGGLTWFKSTDTYQKYK